MTGATVAMPATTEPWVLPSKGRVGMLCLIVAESAVFVIFIVAYLYLPRTEPERTTAARRARTADLHQHLPAREQPDDFSGGARARTRAHERVQALVARHDRPGGDLSRRTAREWYLLIYEHGLTIRTNLFGTTYYSLVGLHATHVILGLRGAHSSSWCWRGSGTSVREHAERTDVLAHVLALRRCRVGRRVHGRLRHRALDGERPHGRHARFGIHRPVDRRCRRPPRCRWR